MKIKLLTIFFFIILIPYVLASQNTKGEHTVESSLTVHDTTSEPPVLFVDSSTHFVGVNASTPTVALDVGGGTKTTVDGVDDLLVADDVEVDGSIYGESEVFAYGQRDLLRYILMGD